MEMMNILPFEKSYLLSRFTQMAPLRRSKKIFPVTSANKILYYLNKNITKKTILKHSYNFCFYCFQYLHSSSCFSAQMLRPAPNTDTQWAYVGKYIFPKAANLIPFLSQTVNFFLGHSASDFMWRHLKQQSYAISHLRPNAIKNTMSGSLICKLYFRDE